MKIKKMSRNIFKTVFMCLFMMLMISQVSYAQTEDYVVLAPLPGIGDETGQTTTLEKYLPRAFNLTVAIAAGLAFVVITFGGLMYATSDSISGKEDGKGYIKNAITGLILVIGSYVILYTINPQILNLNLRIDAPVINGAVEGGVTTVSGGNRVGCQGVCSYTYTNGSGEKVSYKDCSACSDAQLFGLDIKTDVVDGKNVQINTTMGLKLRDIRGTASTPAFQVTETWPPTVNHAAQGQYNGTSVDVKLFNPTPENIVTFINNSAAQGLTAIYEVKGESERSALIKAGVRGVNIITVGYITAGHFSVYNRY
jgi:hypothetical protein